MGKPIGWTVIRWRLSLWWGRRAGDVGDGPRIAAKRSPARSIDPTQIPGVPPQQGTHSNVLRCENVPRRGWPDHEIIQIPPIFKAGEPTKRLGLLGVVLRWRLDAQGGSSPPGPEMCGRSHVVDCIFVAFMMRARASSPHFDQTHVQTQAEKDRSADGRGAADLAPRSDAPKEFELASLRSRSRSKKQATKPAGSEPARTPSRMS